MRSLITSVTTVAFLVFAGTLAATKPGCAGTVINACGNFVFWVPDDWTMDKDVDSVEQSAFDSKDDDLYVVSGPLADKTADLSDDDVTDFADEQFDDMKVTSDKTDKMDDMDIRLVEGTGMDDDDPIVFKMLALDTGSGVLVVLVSGDAKNMALDANQPIIDRILHSLRPQK